MWRPALVIELTNHSVWDRIMPPASLHWGLCVKEKKRLRLVGRGLRDGMSAWVRRLCGPPPRGLGLVNTPHTPHLHMQSNTSTVHTFIHPQAQKSSPAKNADPLRQQAAVYITISTHSNPASWQPGAVATTDPPPPHHTNPPNSLCSLRAEKTCMRQCVQVAHGLAKCDRIE